jgi:hypothetical protein
MGTVGRSGAEEAGGRENLLREEAEGGEIFVASGFAQIRVDVRTSVTSNRFGGVWLEPLWQRFPVSPATYNLKFCININHDCGDINRFSSDSTENVKQYGA